MPSRASEWSKRTQEVQREQPLPFSDPGRSMSYPGPYLDASVDAAGHMRIMVNDGQLMALRPIAALALARWILDTFGEAP